MSTLSIDKLMRPFIRTSLRIDRVVGKRRLRLKLGLACPPSNLNLSTKLPIGPVAYLYTRTYLKVELWEKLKLGTISSMGRQWLRRNKNTIQLTCPSRSPSTRTSLIEGLSRKRKKTSLFNHRSKTKFKPLDQEPPFENKGPHSKVGMITTKYKKILESFIHHQDNTKRTMISTRMMNMIKVLIPTTKSSTSMRQARTQPRVTNHRCCGSKGGSRRKWITSCTSWTLQKGKKQPQEQMETRSSDSLIKASRLATKKRRWSFQMWKKWAKRNA